MISTVATVATTLTMTQVINYSIIPIIALIAFLALKEILSSGTHENKKMQSFVEGINVAIVPLLMVFASIVTYKLIAFI